MKFKLNPKRNVINKIIVVLFLFAISCDNDSVKPVEESYRICDNLLGKTCDGNGFGEYCTFGFKWGEGNPFTDAGLEKPGPAIGPVVITYRFQDSGFVFNTHSQSNLTSLSFDIIVACAKDTLRSALSKWEAVADIEFVEKTSDEESDIKIIVAKIEQGGLGYPAYPDEPCSKIAGLLVFKSTANYTCKSFYAIALHEIGHVLGLGHVISDNVMNPDSLRMELQSGDSIGVQSIYGEK